MVSEVAPLPAAEFVSVRVPSIPMVDRAGRRRRGSVPRARRCGRGLPMEGLQSKKKKKKVLRWRVRRGPSVPVGCGGFPVAALLGLCRESLACRWLPG